MSSEENKFVSLDEVVEDIKKRELMGMWAYTKGINFWADAMMFPQSTDVIITEDAEFEVIKPKELPQLDRPNTSEPEQDGDKVDNSNNG